MFKKVLAVMLAGAIMFIASGCIKNGVRYIEVKESIPRNVIDVVLESYDEDELFKESDLIFEGKVIDEKEIGLEEYIDGELRNTYYIDVFTFKIKKIYYTKDSSIKNGDVITVGNGSCSNYWIRGTIEMKKDKEYIVLTEKVYDTKTVEFSKYMDFAVVTHWMAIISVENEDYFFDEVFTSLKSGAKEEKIRKDGDFKTKIYKKGKEFEKELEDLISKKKGGR